MTSRSSCGAGPWRLADAVVALAVATAVGVLLFPFLASARATSGRVVCSARMKNVARGLLELHERRGVFPPLCAPSAEERLTVAGPYRGPYGRTLFHWLLPYVDCRREFDSLDGEKTYEGLAGHTAIPAYLCPEDVCSEGGKPRNTYGGANDWGTGNFGANYLVFGDPEHGTTEGAARIDDSFPDGTSHSLVFAELFGACRNDPEAAYFHGSLWASSNSVWRPVVCIDDPFKEIREPGYRPCPKFQVAPNWTTGCDTGRAQGNHPGGINTAMADGAVRFAAADVTDAAWAEVCDPRDAATSAR
jgi:prepilin-type processing-associated H-X9-DG protein